MRKNPYYKSIKKLLRDKEFKKNLQTVKERLPRKYFERGTSVYSKSVEELNLIAESFEFSLYQQQEESAKKFLQELQSVNEPEKYVQNTIKVEFDLYLDRLEDLGDDTGYIKRLIYRTSRKTGIKPKELRERFLASKYNIWQHTYGSESEEEFRAMYGMSPMAYRVVDFLKNKV